MKIQLDGLTPEQQALAQQLWDLDGPDEIIEFVMSLPPARAREATTIMRLMMLAMEDTTTDLSQATEVLNRYRLQ